MALRAVINRLSNVFQGSGGAGGNSATGNYSAVSGGQFNSATNTGSVVLGGSQNTASGNFGIVGGFGAQDRGRYGTVVYASGIFSALADAQPTLAFVLRGSTTDAATGVRLTADGAAAGAANSFPLANNSTAYIRGWLVAQVSATSSKAWDVSVLLRRGANAAATSMIGAGAATGTFGDAALSTITVTIAADTTNGGLSMTVNGVAATNIKYVFYGMAVEVVG